MGDASASRGNPLTSGHWIARPCWQRSVPETGQDAAGKPSRMGFSGLRGKLSHAGDHPAVWQEPRDVPLPACEWPPRCKLRGRTEGPFRRHRRCASVTAKRDTRLPPDRSAVNLLQRDGTRGPKSTKMATCPERTRDAGERDGSWSWVWVREERVHVHDRRAPSARGPFLPDSFTPSARKILGTQAALKRKSVIKSVCGQTRTRFYFVTKTWTG